MSELADLQAQIVALRLAVEGTWLSLIGGAADPIGDAERLGRENLAAIDQLPTTTEDQRAARDAVKRHTEQLWGSIAWQLRERATKG